MYLVDDIVQYRDNEELFTVVDVDDSNGDPRYTIEELMLRVPKKKQINVTDEDLNLAPEDVEESEDKLRFYDPNDYRQACWE